jgi:hypothetical protein
MWKLFILAAAMSVTNEHPGCGNLRAEKSRLIVAPLVLGG